MINISVYTSPTCSGPPVFSELYNPLSHCSNYTTFPYTSGYGAYSCGLEVQTPYEQAQKFAMEVEVSGSTTCAITENTPFYEEIVGLNTCYRLLVDGVELSVIYNQVSSSNTAQLEYSKTLFTTSTGCTGPSTVSYETFSSTCQANATSDSSVSVSTITELPEDMPPLFAM